MFILQADKNNLKIQEKEMVTSGSVNIYLCRFNFDKNWDELDRTAVFKCGDKAVQVSLNSTPDPDIVDKFIYECQIPWEVLQEPNRILYIGVRGTKGTEVVLPTIWASAGTVKEGVSPSDAGVDIPTNKYDELKEEISKKGDSLEYDGISLSLLSDGKEISSVSILSSGNPGDIVTGVTSFNGRTGSVKPQAGDYTAEMVGALPSNTSIPSMPEDVGADPAGAAESVKQEILQNLDGKLDKTGGTVTGEISFIGNTSPLARNNSATNNTIIDLTGIHYNGSGALELTQNGVSVIPTNLSQLNNDTGFITDEDIPIVPSKISQLENDSNYATEQYVQDAVSNASPGSGKKYTAGDGITIQNDSISVTEPVKGVTQSEYNSLTEAQKNYGLYIITD